MLPCEVDDSLEAASLERPTEVNATENEHGD